MFKPQFLLLISLVPALAGCDAIWGTSADLSPDVSVSAGVTSGYDPYYYNPYYNPYYYGPVFNGPYIAHHPHWINRPAYGPGPTQPVNRPEWNGAGGNVRPGAGTSVAQPSQQPSAPAIKLPTSAAQVRGMVGSNPGLVTPPAGSGLHLQH